MRYISKVEWNLPLYRQHYADVMVLSVFVWFFVSFVISLISSSHHQGTSFYGFVFFLFLCLAFATKKRNWKKNELIVSECDCFIRFAQILPTKKFAFRHLLAYSFFFFWILCHLCFSFIVFGRKNLVSQIGIHSFAIAKYWLYLLCLNRYNAYDCFCADDFCAQPQSHHNLIHK